MAARVSATVRACLNTGAGKRSAETLDAVSNSFDPMTPVGKEVLFRRKPTVDNPDSDYPRKPVRKTACIR